jgi:hypothetical protein
MVMTCGGAPAVMPGEGPPKKTEEVPAEVREALPKLKEKLDDLRLGLQDALEAIEAALSSGQDRPRAVTGTVVRTSATEIVIADSAGIEYRLETEQVRESTREVGKGDEVRASYVREGDRRLATKVTVLGR